MNLARTISIRATYVIGFRAVPVRPSGVLVEWGRAYFPWAPTTRTHIICSKLIMVDPMRESKGADPSCAHKYFPEYTP